MTHVPPRQALKMTDFKRDFNAVILSDYPAFDPKIFKNPPVICGLNHVRAKDTGKVILAAKPVVISAAGGTGYPRHSKMMNSLFLSWDGTLK